MNITDPDKIYTAEELACGENVIFAGCGITAGNLMNGVRFFKGGARTESLVISSQSKTARFVDTVHMTGKPKSVQVR
jgi:fructose-1,6-bisphosphatase II / sedoheptulose-1,7-bisphosphatase